jgi:predicted AlkP superfamily phosphohydrolase/phosphomutase
VNNWLEAEGYSNIKGEEKRKKKGFDDKNKKKKDENNVSNWLKKKYHYTSHKYTRTTLNLCYLDRSKIPQIKGI